MTPHVRYDTNNPVNAKANSAAVPAGGGAAAGGGRGGIGDEVLSVIKLSLSLSPASRSSFSIEKAALCDLMVMSIIQGDKKGLFHRT